MLTADAQRTLHDRLRAGDRDAEDEFARFFIGRLRLMIAVRIKDRDAAQDLAQEATVAALGAIKEGHLREPERLAAFVHGVGRNIANNHIRRRQAVPPPVPLDADAIAAPSVDVLVEEADRRALAERALATLGADERQVLALTLVEGLKPGVIATRLGLSPDVVRTRKSRALKKVIAEVARLSRLPGRGH